MVTQAKRRRPGARQRGYGRRWEALSKAFAEAWIAAGRPCAFCGRPIRPGARWNVDHVVRVVDDPDRLLDPSNLRTAHHHCHSRRTAQDLAAARRGYRLGTGADGLPLDPGHPFNRGNP